MKLLGISGSLRAESSNARLLQAAAALIPTQVQIEIADCIGHLPHFNPDIDPNSDKTTATWIEQVKQADGLIVSTPEYARGYPGSLKNAFDWLVQTDAHIDKPFMMLHASARSSVARDTLTTVIETMSGIHMVEASTTINLLGKTLTQEDILKEHGEDLSQALTAFIKGVELFNQRKARE